MAKIVHSSYVGSTKSRERVIYVWIIPCSHTILFKLSGFYLLELATTERSQPRKCEADLTVYL